MCQQDGYVIITLGEKKTFEFRGEKYKVLDPHVNAYDSIVLAINDTKKGFTVFVLRSLGDAWIHTL